MWVNPVNFRLEVPAEAVAALEAMGFPAERARAALAADPHGVATAGAADRAVEWLLEHPEEVLAGSGTITSEIYHIN